MSPDTLPIIWYVFFSFLFFFILYFYFLGLTLLSFAFLFFSQVQFPILFLTYSLLTFQVWPLFLLGDCHFFCYLPDQSIYMVYIIISMLASHHARAVHLNWSVYDLVIFTHMYFYSQIIIRQYIISLSNFSCTVLLETK